MFPKMRSHKMLAYVDSGFNKSQRTKLLAENTISGSMRDLSAYEAPAGNLYDLFGNANR